jgi:inosose dehydratase
VGWGRARAFRRIHLTLRIAYSRPGAPDLLPALYEGARRWGYAGLQLKAEQYAPYLDDPAAFMEEHAERVWDTLGIVAAGEHLEPLRPAVDFAGFFSLPVVSVVYTGSRAEPPDDRAFHAGRILTYIGGYARSVRTRVSLLNHRQTAIESAADLAGFCEAVEAATVGIALDTGHLALAGDADIPNTLRRCAPWIDVVHLKDVNAGECCPLGAGELDLEGIIAALREIRFDRLLVVDDESADLPLEESLRHSMAWLRSHELA